MFTCLVLCSIVLLHSTSICIEVDVKVVQSHSQIGQGQTGIRLGAGNLHGSRPRGALCAHSGLTQIQGKCYDIEVDDYRYNVCPFDNITQHEVAIKWNAYHGILGIWSHWQYDEDYSVLLGGIYTDGDSCAKDGKPIPRFVILHHVCGERTRITRVTEPTTCQYDITFASPLFCHDVFADVYNALPQAERPPYATATAEFNHNILTAEGLRVARETVLKRTGCLFKERVFQDVETCTREYSQLSQLYEKLSRTRQQEGQPAGEGAGEPAGGDEGEPAGEGAGELTEKEESQNTEHEKEMDVAKFRDLEHKFNVLQKIMSDNGLIFPDEL